MFRAVAHRLSSSLTVVARNTVQRQCLGMSCRFSHRSFPQIAIYLPGRILTVVLAVYQCICSGTHVHIYIMHSTATAQYARTVPLELELELFIRLQSCPSRATESQLTGIVSCALYRAQVRPHTSHLQPGDTRA
jgi:hypothetical protein